MPDGFDWDSLGAPVAKNGKAEATDWDGLGIPVAEAQQQAKADAAVPFQPEPGVNRLNVLPFAVDAGGNVVRGKSGLPELYMPEFLAAPIRGAVKAGQEILGERPVNEPESRGDILSALSFGAGRAPGAVPADYGLGDIRLHFADPEPPPPAIGGPAPTGGPGPTGGPALGLPAPAEAPAAAAVEPPPVEPPPAAASPAGQPGGSEVAQPLLTDQTAAASPAPAKPPEAPPAQTKAKPRGPSKSAKDAKPGDSVTFFDHDKGEYQAGTLVGTREDGRHVINTGAGPYKIVPSNALLSARGEPEEAPAETGKQPAAEGKKQAEKAPPKPEGMPPIGQTVMLRTGDAAEPTPHTITGYHEFAPGEWTFTAQDEAGNSTTDGIATLARDTGRKHDLSDAPNGPWEPVGKNEDGQTVYRNPNGVHAINEDGVPYSEATRDGKPVATDETRKPQFQVAKPKPEQPVAKVKSQPAQAAKNGKINDVTHFTTAQGSTYEVHDDGTTTRDKSHHPEHGANDVGTKPRSARTIYVDADKAAALSAAGLSNLGDKGARLVLRNGKASLLTWNEAAGQWGVAPSGRDIPFSTQPEVGKAPVEAWEPKDDVSGHEAYAGQHAGNVITQMRRGSAPSTEPTRPAKEANPKSPEAGQTVPQSDESSPEEQSPRLTRPTAPNSVPRVTRDGQEAGSGQKEAGSGHPASGQRAEEAPEPLAHQKNRLPKTWRTELTFGNGEWRRDGLRFATKQEAEAYADFDRKKWSDQSDYLPHDIKIATRVLESDDAVNARWDVKEGGLVQLPAASRIESPKPRMDVDQGKGRNAFTPEIVHHSAVAPAPMNPDEFKKALQRAGLTVPPHMMRREYERYANILFDQDFMDALVNAAPNSPPSMTVKGQLAIQQHWGDASPGQIVGQMHNTEALKALADGANSSGLPPTKAIADGSSIAPSGRAPEKTATKPTAEASDAEYQAGWNSLTGVGRGEALAKAGIRLPDSVLWRNISPANKAKLRPHVSPIPQPFEIGDRVKTKPNAGFALTGTVQTVYPAGPGWRISLNGREYQSNDFEKAENKAAPDPQVVNNKGSTWVEIGKNRDGNTLWQNQDGVRSYTENGIRSTEGVRIAPNGRVTVPSDGERGADYKVAEWHPSQMRSAPEYTGDAIPPDIQAIADANGIDTAGRTPEEVADDIVANLSPADVEAEIGRLNEERHDAYQEAERQAINWIAHHGSPHLFGQFDIRKIGTGEGNAAYGWGIYLAENPSIADGYRSRLKATALINKAAESYSEVDRPADAEEALMQNPELTPQERTLLAALKDDDWLGFDYPHQAVQAALKPDAADRYDLSPETQAAIDAFTGHLYTVRIKASPDEMLGWDKPFAEQPPVVRRGLAAIYHGMSDDERERFEGTEKGRSGAIGEWISKGPNGEADFGSLTGEDFVNGLEEVFGNRAASQKMHAEGIKGVRYLDAGSRRPPPGAAQQIGQINREIAEREAAIDGLKASGAPQYEIDGHQAIIDELKQKLAGLGGDKTHNIVVFSDKDIEITHRDGEPLTAQEKVYGQDQDRPLEELEHEQQSKPQEDIPPAAQQRPGGDEQPRPAAGNQEAVPSGAPEGRSDVGAAGGDEAGTDPSQFGGLTYRNTQPGDVIESNDGAVWVVTEKHRGVAYGQNDGEIDEPPMPIEDWANWRKIPDAEPENGHRVIVGDETLEKVRGGWVPVQYDEAQGGEWVPVGRVRQHASPDAGTFFPGFGDPQAQKQEDGNRVAPAETTEPTALVETAADRPVDSNGNPIFKQGERVVIAEGRFAGRHGEVTEAQGMVWQSWGGQKSGTAYHYTVRTDAGSTSLETKLQPETAPAPEVTPDPVYDGRPVTAAVLHDDIERHKRSEQHYIGAAARARLAKKKAAYRSDAQRARQQADAKQAVLNDWIAAHPQAAQEQVPDLVTADQPAQTAAPVNQDNMTLVETKHGKTGEKLFVVTMQNRVPREEYDRMVGIAGRHNGRYSSFRGRGAIPGWVFKNRDNAQGFMAEVSGQPATSVPPAPPPPLPTPTPAAAAPPAPPSTVTGTIVGPHPEWATDHESDVGGRVIYSDPEVALIEGYSILNGQPVYAGITSDGQRTRVDIASYTGSAFTPAQLDRLKQARTGAIARDRIAFEAHPQGPFVAGEQVARSASIKPSIAELAQDWLTMLGIDKRVFIADPRDVMGASGDAYHLNGPYASIRSAGVTTEEGGSMRRLPNGDYYIALAPRPRLSATLETLAHEIGHIVEKETWDSAPEPVKASIRAAFDRFIVDTKDQPAADYVRAMRPHTTGKLTKPGNTTADTKAGDMSAYWRSFGEWFADQVARWATTEGTPVSATDRLFDRIGAAQKRLAESATGGRYLPAEQMRRFLNDRAALLNAEPPPVPIEQPPVSSAPLQPPGEAAISTTQEAASDGANRPEDSGVGEPGSGQPRAPRPSAGQPSGNRHTPGMAPQPAENAASNEGGRDRGKGGLGAGSEAVGGATPVYPERDAADGRGGTGDERMAAAGSGDGSPEQSHPAATRPNFWIDDPERLVGGTPKVRFARNRAALEAYEAIEQEQREPTPEELNAMAGYIGWGSFGQDLFRGTFEYQPPRPGWDEEGKWLRNHLGKEAWESANRSIINAHYTDPPTVQTMWEMVQRMGFKGGRILEPSMGIGNFFGMMPRDIMANSDLTGIELDRTTGGMAKLLYPQANIQIKGYQDSKTPDNFYDLVIGNWPFAAQSPPDRRYDRLSPTLHNYFFLKALDQTRPGGLVIGITSSGTMDSAGRAARLEMAKKGELLAAFRLPSGAFEKYAGTSVVTDILVFRKREQPLTDPANEPWINATDMDVPSGYGQKIRVNEYFQNRPENVLGTLDFGHGTTQGRAGMIVHRPDNLMERLRALPEQLPEGAFQPIVRGGEPRFIVNNTTDRQNSVVIGEDGKLYQVQGERLALLQDIHKGLLAGSAKLQKAREDQVRRLVDMRKTYGALIDAERDGAPNTENLRTKLADQYRQFSDKHGPLNGSDGLCVLDRVKDPSTPLLEALEKPDGSPSRILSEPTVRSKKSLDNPSIADAYVLARNEQSHIDIDRIAELAKRPRDEVELHLIDSGAIYRTPGGGFEAGDAYLSGNVRRKLAEAKEALERGEDMQKSVDALTEALPPPVPYFQIEAKLGAPWVGDQAYKDFLADLLNLKGETRQKVHVRFTGGRWKVHLPPELRNTEEAETIHGHPRIRFDRLVQAAMGNQVIKIYDPKDRDGGPYFNSVASEEANAKVQELREKFTDWAWSDPERKFAFEHAYNEVMNAIAKPRFDGSFMDMSGMALRRGEDPFSLRRHQINAIWRGVAQGRGLFAHEVGTGKTYTMGGIAVEGRRYGVHRKPLIFGHNANSAAVAREIQEMYPGAKIHYVSNLSPDIIATEMHRIANEDWDAIVMPHSLIDRMALSEATLMQLAADDIAALENEAIEAAQEDGIELTPEMMDDPESMKKVRSPTAKQLVKQREAIIANIKKQANRSSKEGAVSFEQLGVDSIIVDEAHEFKKPPIATRMQMKGLNTQASARSISLNFLTSYVKQQRAGKGVYLFTGTPITNTLNEIFNMSRYFMDDRLEQNGIKDWDAWFGTFADGRTDVELSAAGTFEPVSRLSAFVNTDELVKMMSEFTDVVQAKDMPEFVARSTPSGKVLTSPNLTAEDRDYLENGRTTKPIGRPYKKIINDIGEMSPEQKAILTHLQKLSREFKNATGKQRREWMLKGDEHSPILIETAASNASLDARMADPDASDWTNSKVNRVARNILRIYTEPKAAQMVFVDRGYSASKTSAGHEDRFVLVQDLVRKLVEGGIPRNEIAIIDGGVDALKKRAIADAMNEGTIRVAIGQSGTMGVGVNAQRNLRAMHHLDAPWRPGDLEQRNGRGERQGNEWNTVQEYRYITEGIDGRRWQVLAAKDRFIKQFVNAFNDDSGKRLGTIEGDAADISEDENIMETLGAAAGDPRLMVKAKLKNDLERLQRRERIHSAGQREAIERVRELRQSANALERRAQTVGGWADLWEEGQNRAAAAAVKAGDKRRWYEADIDGRRLNVGEDIQNALDAGVQKLVKGEEITLGTMNGFKIIADWKARWGDPSYSVASSDGEDIAPIDAPTVRRIANVLNGLRGKEGLLHSQAKNAIDSIPALEAAGRQDFPQMDKLQKIRQQLAKLDDDLQTNPIPPPPWLRYGAPIDTEIFVNGEPRIVRGHRIGDDTYLLVTDEGDVPYMDAYDESGQHIYEQHAPPSKKDEKDDAQ